jgi:hypothetical protein
MSLNYGQSLQSAFVPAKSTQNARWKTAYEKVVWEVDAKKLLTEIHLVEQALFLRWQQVGDEAGNAIESAAMESAAEDLLAIKIHRLGWPDPRR